uniref:PDZ domain-containing protein n=1 Tax=Calcidiscus leptoporus TaxID=127549 RepID=A0A7S0JLN4_9EUKA
MAWRGRSRPQQNVTAPSISLSDLSLGKQRLNADTPPTCFDVFVRRGIDNRGPSPKIVSLGIKLIGSRVAYILRGSPAERAKLQPFDLVVAVDGVRLEAGHSLAEAVKHKRAPTLTIERPAVGAWTMLAQYIVDTSCPLWLGAAMACASGDTDAVLANVHRMMDGGIEWASRPYNDADICTMHLLAAAELGVQIGLPLEPLPVAIGMNLIEFALELGHSEMVACLLQLGHSEGAPQGSRLPHVAHHAELQPPSARPSGKGKGKCHQRSPSGGACSSAGTDSASSSDWSGSLYGSFSS